MKRLILILFIIFFAFPAFAKPHNRYLKKPSKSEVKAKKKLDQIELIEGVPDRPHKKLVPIHSQCTSLLVSNCMKSAIKGAKKQAYKAGGDAIIELKVETASQGGGGVAAGSYGAFGAATQYQTPVITGWAVKWVDSPAEPHQAKNSKN